MPKEMATDPSLLDNNILRGPISLTRSRDSFVKDWIGDVPILVLDKDKLRNNYKIRPYQSYDDNEEFEDEDVAYIDIFDNSGSSPSENSNHQGWGLIA